MRHTLEGSWCVGHPAALLHDPCAPDEFPRRTTSRGLPDNTCRRRTGLAGMAAPTRTTQPGRAAHTVPQWIGSPRPAPRPAPRAERAGRAQSGRVRRVSWRAGNQPARTQRLSPAAAGSPTRRPPRSRSARETGSACSRGTPNSGFRAWRRATDTRCHNHPRSPESRAHFPAARLSSWRATHNGAEPRSPARSRGRGSRPGASRATRVAPRGPRPARSGARRS